MTAIDKAKILIVEDEPAIAELISFAVRSVGCKPVAVSTATDAWNLLLWQMPDLVLLDWMLPDQSGLQLLSRIRESRQLRALPVIMLTAKGVEEDKIAGLNQGADDYVTKPFSPRELGARVNALLRRKIPERSQSLMKAGAIVLDPVSCTVTVENRKIDIGNAEYKLLKFLMAHPERVFSRNQLLDKVWGSLVAIEERTVDVHVLRLRKALKDKDYLIKTMRCIGYMFSEGKDK
jgi:two-component system phosphate regulon response regulator PhoB